MQLTKELFLDLLDVGPIVIGILKRDHKHVQMERDSVEELSDILNNRVTDIIIPGISPSRLKFSFSPEDTRREINPYDVLRDIEIYRQKRNTLNSGQPVPVLVFGKKEQDRGIRTYGIIIPDKLTHEIQHWPYRGTFHGLRDIFRADNAIMPIFDSGEIKDTLEGRLEEGNLYAGTTLNLLLHPDESDGNVISIRMPFKFPFYFRYERGVFIAYQHMRNTLRNMTARGEMPILLRPLEIPKGRIARSSAGIMKYMVDPNSELRLQYAPLSPLEMDLYNSKDLFQKAVDLSTQKTYSLRR